LTNSTGKMFFGVALISLHPVVVSQSLFLDGILRTKRHRLDRLRTYVGRGFHPSTNPAGMVWDFPPNC